MALTEFFLVTTYPYVLRLFYKVSTGREDRHDHLYPNDTGATWLGSNTGIALNASARSNVVLDGATPEHFQPSETSH